MSAGLEIEELEGKLSELDAERARLILKINTLTPFLAFILV